jgi:hypothetical protein
MAGWKAHEKHEHTDRGRSTFPPPQKKKKTNRIQLFIFGLQIRTSSPCSAAINRIRIPAGQRAEHSNLHGKKLTIFPARPISKRNVCKASVACRNLQPQSRAPLRRSSRAPADGECLPMKGRHSALFRLILFRVGVSCGSTWLDDRASDDRVPVYYRAPDDRVPCGSTWPPTTRPSDSGHARWAHSSRMHAAAPSAVRKSTHGSFSSSMGSASSGLSLELKATGNQNSLSAWHRGGRPRRRVSGAAMAGQRRGAGQRPTQG